MNLPVASHAESGATAPNVAVGIAQWLHARTGLIWNVTVGPWEAGDADEKKRLVTATIDKPAASAGAPRTGRLAVTLVSTVGRHRGDFRHALELHDLWRGE